MLEFRSRAFIALLFLLCISLAHAHNKVVVIPLGSDDAPPATVYEIGDEGPAGGIVFHVTNDGINGLEAALEDQPEAPWNCFGVDVGGVDNITVKTISDNNSGIVNTSLIAETCPGDNVSAAVLAAVYVWPNGQTGGFLPNKEELNLLYAQRNLFSGLSSGHYWSSSESGNNLIDAWYVDFNGGVPGFIGTNPKTSNNGVRPVRAF